jgi:predicted esterase
MRDRLLFLLLCGALVLCGCPADDDDDSSGTDDDDAAGCVVDGSGGSGGASEGAWLPVGGWTTDGDVAPDYEVYVFAPANLVSPAPVAILTSNPVQPDRGEIERLITDYISYPNGLDAWAELQGFIVAFPVGGVVEQGQLAFRFGFDESFMSAAIDAIAGNYDIDRNSVHLFGRSGGGRVAMQMAEAHSEKVASIMSLAGPNPFNSEPDWEQPVAGLFIHDPDDPVVSRTSVQARVEAFEDGGAHVETFFDYTGGHDWDAAQIEPRMADFFVRMCL